MVQRFEAPCFVSDDKKKQLYNDLRKKLLGLTEVKPAPDIMNLAGKSELVKCSDCGKVKLLGAS